jgi:hypothetical protein
LHTFVQCSFGAIAARHCHFSGWTLQFGPVNARGAAGSKGTELSHSFTTHCFSIVQGRLFIPNGRRGQEHIGMNQAAIEIGLHLRPVQHGIKRVDIGQHDAI